MVNSTIEKLTYMAISIALYILIVAFASAQSDAMAICQQTHSYDVCLTELN
jgi:hypothetical protein